MALRIVQSPFMLGLATLVSFAANTISRYPGIGNPDSKHQYEQAVSGHYADWHPPIMAWLWAQLRVFGDGSGPIYVFQNLFCWSGYGLIALTLNRLGRRHAAWMVLAIGLFPSFMMMNVQLLKDVGLAGVFLSAFAVLFWFRAREKKLNPLIAVFATALILYGILVRANGAFAAAPLIVYMIYPKLLARPIRLLAVCAMIVVLAIPFFGFINHKILRATPTYPQRSLEIYDIAGVARFSGDVSVFGPGTGIAMQQVRDCYIPEQWDTMGAGGKCHKFWDHLAVPAGVSVTHKSDGSDETAPLNPALAKLWLAAITKHPVAYLMHRIDHFNSELYFIVPRHHADFRVLFHIVYGTPIDLSEFQSTKAKIMDHLRSNPFSMPVFAFVLDILVLIMSWPRATKKAFPLQRDIFCLAASGFIYTAAYFFVGVASDVRYQYWTMLAAFVGAVLCISARKEDFFPPSRVGWTSIAVVLGTALLVQIAQTLLGDAFYPPG